MAVLLAYSRQVPPSDGQCIFYRPTSATGQAFLNPGELGQPENTLSQADLQAELTMTQRRDV